MIRIMSDFGNANYCSEVQERSGYAGRECAPAIVAGFLMSERKAGQMLSEKERRPKGRRYVSANLIPAIFASCRAVNAYSVVMKILW